MVGNRDRTPDEAKTWLSLYTCTLHCVDSTVDSSIFAKERLWIVDNKIVKKGDLQQERKWRATIFHPVTRGGVVQRQFAFKQSLKRFESYSIL